MDFLMGQLESFAEFLKAASIILATIGFLGLGMMYVLSPVPVFADWKANHPKAFSQVVTGLVILAFAGGTGIATVLSGAL